MKIKKENDASSDHHDSLGTSATELQLTIVGLSTSTQPGRNVSSHQVITSDL